MKLVRRSALVLAAGAVLAVVAVRSSQAATIAQLQNFYRGTAFSRSNTVNELHQVTLEITGRVADRFSAIATLRTGAAGETPIRVIGTGRVGTNGKVGFTGRGTITGDTDIRVNHDGQLSATGRAIHGTLNVRGILRGQRVDERADHSLLAETPAG
ncbi:MAG: hypothetical protein FJX77_13255 [Armatimonadetes bacterium]|nr:hypothetical protein [Armatimonadota bacterium]